MKSINDTRQSIQVEMNRLKAKLRQGGGVEINDIAFSLGVLYESMDDLCAHIATLEAFGRGGA